ncbi:sorbosone dehydrogenase family protein [Catellatospora sp. TT07R-123]|uniref:PQQ-dependent sugar dehydrogenase n=1 Tax=Catellatospora sp. TT07R-123 TaxID=2733863 RepID=UPI001BB3EE59|nr:PQQ-dependent sugar dehydrogenase [Catellatospora sp. TT07R-123]
MGTKRSRAVGAVLTSGLFIMGSPLATALPAAAALAAGAPDAPQITEPGVDNMLVSAADVHMETAPFHDADGDAHLCSDWEIRTGEGERVWYSNCIGGTQKVHTHLGDGIFEGSHAGRHDLIPDRDYEVRVRFRDNSGDPATEWSTWSTRPFRTAKERQPLPDAPQWIVKQPGYRVEEVAGGFQLPVDIAMTPGQTVDPAKPLFYVSELYGQVKVVHGDFSTSTYAKNLLNFNPTGDFPGSGEMGVTGLTVDPASGDVFAAMVYQDGGDILPKVVRFHSTDGGLTAASASTVIRMDKEPQSASHQISNLSIGPDGKLYVHMGDGMDPNRAQDKNSFRGKILRMNLDGSAPSDNPFYDSSDGIDSHDYIFAYGLRNPFGGAWRASDGKLYEVENGPGANDRFARVDRGADYGWDGGATDMKTRALYNWEHTHAPVDITFAEPSVHHASGFPEDTWGHAFVSESGPTYATGPQEKGKRVVEFGFNADGSATGPKTLVEYNGGGKTTVAGITAGPDGIYFSGLYPDSASEGPTGRSAKIYRIRYVPQQADAPVVAYTDRDFKGGFQSFGAGVFDASKGDLAAVGNDKISSLRVAPGYRAVVCADDSAGGRTNAGSLGLCRYYGAGQHDYVGADLNDKPSLISVMSEPTQGTGAIAYRGADGTGPSQSLGVGGYEATAGELSQVGDTMTSSLSVAEGYRAVVCKNDRSGGLNTGEVGPCRFFGPGQFNVGTAFDNQIALIAVGGPAVTAFSDAGFAGQRQAFGPGVYEAKPGQLKTVGNDAITSFRVEPGYHVVACDNDSVGHKNTGDLGPCHTYGEGNHSLAGQPLDNRISLLAVQAGPSGGTRVTVYRDKDFKGASTKLGPGVFQSGNLGAVGNDQVTSLKVASGTRAVVCRHDSAKGAAAISPCRFYAPGDHKYVGADLNDDISLIITGS